MTPDYSELIERLQSLCETLGCPAGIDRIDFLRVTIEALQRELSEARDKALEEAAMVAEEIAGTSCLGHVDQVAVAIRALKGQQ